MIRCLGFVVLVGVMIFSSFRGPFKTCQESILVWAEELSAYAHAMAAYHDRRFEEALSYAKQAVRESPDHPDAYVLLGELYYLRQDLDKAKESWERALKLAPSRADVRKQLEKLGWEEPIENGLSRNDTYPFVVRFAEGQGSIDLGSLRNLLRNTYRVVGQQFQLFPEYPIAVILYPEADFQKVKGLSHQVAGLYDGKIRLPLRKSGPGTSNYAQIERVLRHEYTHALVYDLSKGRCPLWLNEGVAVLQEAQVYAPNVELALKTIQEGKALSWQQLFQKESYEQDKLELYYGHAYLITQYLVKRWGWTEMVGLLKRFGQGYPLADAIRAEYKTDLVTLEKEWLAWVKRTY